MIEVKFVGCRAARQEERRGRRRKEGRNLAFLHKQAADDGEVEHMAMARFTFPHLRLLDLHQKASALVNY